MSNEGCFSISRALAYSRSKAFRPLSFLHHSTFGVRYSAVLFRSYRLRQSNGLFRTAIC